MRPMSKYRLFFILICLVCVIALSLAGVSQGAPGPEQKAAPQVMTATVDKTGQHPGTTAIAGPATVKCLSASSSTANGQPKPSCFVTMPGYSGNLLPGASAGAGGAGTVTLNCNGQGDFLRCSASVQRAVAIPLNKRRALE
jgi:hypothetical protein